MAVLAPLVLGPALTQYTARFTALDANNNPITNGSVSLVITDYDTKLTVLSLTNLPYSGSGGVYSAVIDATKYVAGTRLLHTYTGLDGSSLLVATRRVLWRDNGS